MSLKLSSDPYFEPFLVQRSCKPYIFPLLLCDSMPLPMKPKTSLSTSHNHGKADYIGVAGSVLCLVHCLITPALALGSSLSVNHHTAGSGLDYLFILVNGLAVFFATREHRFPALRIFLWGSFALFSVSLLLEHSFAGFRILGYVGSGLLILGHLYNLIYCRSSRVSLD